MKKVKCINVKPLPGNDVAPPLVLGKEYEILKIHTETITSKHGPVHVITAEHYDVGLISKYNYVTSIESGATLPNSANGGIHWCHPSRFESIN